MPKQIQDRYDFQRECNHALLKDSPERFESTTMGVLTPDEMLEGDKWCEEGRTGREFAFELARRDRIERFARKIESHPKNQKRATA